MLKTEPGAPLNLSDLQNREEQTQTGQKETGLCDGDEPKTRLWETILEDSGR